MLALPQQYGTDMMQRDGQMECWHLPRMKRHDETQELMVEVSIPGSFTHFNVRPAE